MKDGLLHSILATQNALLTTITSNLRAVTLDVDFRRKKFFLNFFYEGDITDDMKEAASCIITEASGPFIDFTLHDSVIRLDPPRPIPQEGFLIFLRAEDQDPVHRDIMYMDRQDRIPHVEERLLGLTALLGRITPELRAVTVAMHCNRNHISVCFYYDRTVLSVSKTLAEEAAASIQRHMPLFTVDTQIVRRDYPEEITYTQESLVYARYESLPKILFLGSTAPS